MSKALPQLLTLSLLGAAIIVLIGIGLESVINSLDDMLEPCQHGTSYNKLTTSCDCQNTPFTGKYCGVCDCKFGQCMVGGTTPKAGSLYGCRCPINTKRFGHKCNLCFANNTASCTGPCAEGYFGPLCDKTCISDLTQTLLFGGESVDATTCMDIRNNGGTCNLCSGHGQCGATGDCECNSNYFNGPNGGCSQTCPISGNGKICSGHGVCEKIAGVPTCACEYGWRGTDCKVPCPGMTTTGKPCSGHGQCLIDYTGTPTTSCNCNQKFRGEACQKECPGDFVACSGHGQCDDNAQCTCNSPVGGITWIGEKCTCSDFVTCNGNGNCNPNGDCVCLGNWGGKHCRQCEENYHGSTCQFKCNSDAEPSTEELGCYGRGTCTVLDFARSSESIVCECFGATKIFDDGKLTTVFSNYETTSNCQDCAAGYVPKITAVDQYGLPDGITVPCELYCDSLTCNKLGECNENWGLPNEPLCHCDHGPDNKKHLDDNNFCLSCESGWFPEDLHSADGCSNFCTTDIALAPYLGNFPSICATGVVDCKHCSGHGTCSGRGECLCEEGYAGVECNINCAGLNGLTCSGNGECKVNQLQELMQFEYEFVGSSGALYSCECDPKDPYSDEERKDFRLRVASGEINGTLEDPPVKTFYGEMCEYSCKSPPWAQSEVCNGFGKCEINRIQNPNGGFASCTTDDDCKNNAALSALLSGAADWSSEKGPFCHKGDAPPGCTSSNFTNDDCVYILSLQRPTAARGKECMRDLSCRNFMDGHDWHSWCDTIQSVENPFTTCSNSYRTYCPRIKSGESINSACTDVVNQLNVTTFSITDQINYCYEKDKAKYPFNMTEAYRYNKAVEKHDEVAESFQNFAIKYPTVTMDSTQYCAQYLEMFDVPVTHIRTDTLFICDNKIQHTDNCSTTVLALDTVWKPFYVDCNGVETQYSTLEEAIDNRHEGCVVVEEVVEVENATLQTIFNVKSQLGQSCVDNADCVSNLCYEGSCCTPGTDTTNCNTCNSQGTCNCLPGAVLVNSSCTYDNTTCTGVSYWLDNVGCVNQAVGEACFKDAGCQSEECIGGTCASQESPNCVQVNAAGECTLCITDATLSGTTCTPNGCPSDKMFVTDEGCVDRPSDALEQQVQSLLEKTCSNAESIFPHCKLPTNACDVNGISACKNGDTCEPFESDAMCSTVGILNATCKFGLQAVPLSFSTYKCVGNFTIDNTCLEAARETNWFSFCKDSNAVLFHDNFGVDALQENEQPTVITLEDDQRGGDLLSLWVKTNSILQSSATVAAKSGSDEIFRVFLHQGQIQLNGISTIESCPVDQPTCNDDFSHNINEWLNIKVSITYGASRSVTLHYNGKTTTDGFLCTGCSAVSGVSTIHIEAGAAETYYDEIIFSKAIAPPTAKTSCSTYNYCDYNVDYRDKCIDLLTNVKYPRTVEPQLDVIDTCKSRKIYKTFVGAVATPSMRDEMDLLNWTTYCKFKEELDDSITCGNLTHTTLEDYPTKCDPWISPVDTSKTCVIQNLQNNWTQHCQTIDDAFIPTNMKSNCSEACYQHLHGYEQCSVRKTIFTSNVDIPLSVSGCNSINWLNYCNNVAQNKQPGVCSAVECDCSAQEGMTGDSCDLFCNIASDGSPCGVDSGVGVCRYSQAQLDQLAVGPFTTELIELLGECECFASEGSSNCDQQCVACVNTTYGGANTAENINIGNDGSTAYVHNGLLNPNIDLCPNTPITFSRTSSGHTLRLVREADCPECKYGSYNTLPTSSVSGWSDVSSGSPVTISLTDPGIYFYICVSHASMVGKITVDTTCGGQIGICDASRGICQCLPPWVIERHVEYETWKGDIRRRLERKYILPTSLTSVQPNTTEYDKAQEDIFRIRMMQGREAFTRYYLDTTTTEDNWKTIYASFKLNPSTFTCSQKPCDFHDVMLLGNLQESSFNYNYDCAKSCPSVDTATKIPCNGHGRCAITGSCVCDPAKVIRGTDASTGSTFQINIFGGETIEESEFMVSKLDQTGYRGEDCSLTCPGYHPERQDMTEVCSGHGVCNMDAECQCNIGYTGEVCQFTCPGYVEGDLNVCSGHGTCGMSEVKIFTNIFDEFDETFYINGTAAVRKTNEQPSCPLPASKAVGLGYSVINDIGFLDLTKIYMIRESNLCSSPSINQCKRWKDYQSLYYVNRHPFTIDDYTKPTGCILDGNTIMFNDRTTKVTCENGCLCEGVDELPGVISIHDFMGKEGTPFGYEPLTEWDGFIFKEGGTPTTESQKQMREYECYFYADKVLLQPYIDVESALPSMEVTREECLRYTSETFGLSMFEDVDDSAIAKGCVKKMNSNVLNKVVYNINENSVPCSTTNKCVEKPYERIADGALPAGCLKSGDDIKFNDAAASALCSPTQTCIEKEIKSVDPLIIYHKQIGFNYTENVGRYQTGDLIWTGNFNYYWIYFEESVGSGDLTMSATECEAFATEQSLTFNSVSCSTDGATHPKGCYKKTSGVYFNDCSQAISSTACDEPVTINTFSSGSASGDHLTKAECQQLADDGDGYTMDDVVASGYPSSQYPPGCSLYPPPGFLYSWNSDFTSTYACASDGECVRKTTDTSCIKKRSAAPPTKEYVSNIIAGPDTEATIVSICDNDPDCGGYFGLVPDTEGTFIAVSKFNNALVEDRTEAYRLIGLNTECVGDLNLVIHEKTSGKPDLHKDSLTLEQCRKYAESQPKEFLTDFYTGDPSGCFSYTGKIYFNKQSTTIECSSTRICYESATRRKRNIGAKFYLDDWSQSDGTTSETECQEYATSLGKTSVPGVWQTQAPSGCWIHIGNVRYNTASNTVPCGVDYGGDNVECIKKRSVFFTPWSPVNNDVDLNSCAEVCRVTYQCEYFSVENNVCYMHDGCTQTQIGTNEMYQMQSPEDGRIFTHMTKLPPTLCMTENGAKFDDKTQAPVLRSITLLKANCTGTKIWNAFDEECVEYSDIPRFDAIFFLDKGTDNEKQLAVECQITGNETARCGLCTCFSDYIYGKWAGFTCDTCDVGYGNSQCRMICPSFDGDSLSSMCGGNGACLFGSELNSDGERLFQQANCVCGQDNQYADRQPIAEIASRYPDTGGIDGDGSIVGYYYFTPVPYIQTYASRFDAQTKCSTFNDLDNIGRGGFCFGVYRKYISVTATSPDVYLAMGFVGGSYTLYGKFWQKEAVSGYSKFFNFKRLELYNALEGLPVPRECKDVLSIRNEGFDTCNHFAKESIDPSCTTCEEGWTGKNCRTVCSKCLLGGGCAGVPSESTSSACICPSGAGALWEHQCCPTGFMVADKTTWQGKSQNDVDSIRLSLTYDSSTTNELDASYYCKTCPGVSHMDWMSPDALYKVCSGPTRGTCQPVPGKLELACDCKMNSVTKNRWLGRACACDESINIPYSTDASTAESIDYGCLLPTNGDGICPSGSTQNLFLNPPRIWGQDATYIVGETYGSPFLGVFAGQIFAIRKIICSESSPCHTGEGHCVSDLECAGTLKCFIRNAGEEKLSFNGEKITYDMNYCYHEAETMVGCHPNDFEKYLSTREYHKQFYYDATDSSFKTPELGYYVPYTQDANLAMVIHQQQFTCPKGRYGITVPDRVEYGNGISGAKAYPGTQTQVYSGSSDNPGSAKTQVRRCFEACLNQRTPISGTWNFIAKSFDITNTGACYCNMLSLAAGGVSASSTYSTYDIITEGTWNVCEKCQPGKYQDTTGNVGWVKVYSGDNTGKSISESECSTYATWHGTSFYGPPYSSTGFPHGCFIHSSGIYYQATARSVACSISAICLQHGGGLDIAKTYKHPNCQNCPAGKFGGPIGSWSSILCDVCEPGQKATADGLSCVDCVAGKYELGGVCLTCPNGQFSPQKHPGSVEQPCKACPTGTDTNGQIGTAGTTDAVCRRCPAGKANGVTGGDCIDCGVGKFTSDTGNDQCTPCGVQKFANIAGRTSCKTCGIDAPYVGLYGAVVNGDVCVQCNKGEFVSTTSGFCEDCQQGYDQPLLTYQTSCAICEVGRYGDVLGLADCKLCRGGGTYATSVGEEQADQGQVDCDKCDPGRYADVNGLGVCKVCPAGQYQNLEGKIGCISCPQGKSQDLTGQIECKDCQEGYYNDQIGLGVCKPCAAGTYQQIGNTVAQTSASSCVTCECGYYCIGTARGNCGPGTFSGTGQSQCTAVSEHYYATGTNNCGQTRTCMSTIFAGAQGQCGSTSKCICHNKSPIGSQTGTCDALPTYYETKYSNVQVCTTTWDSLINPKYCQSVWCGNTCSCTFLGIPACCSDNSCNHWSCGHDGGYVTTCVTEKRFYLYDNC